MTRQLGRAWCTDAAPPGCVHGSTIRVPIRVWQVKLREQRVRIPAADCEIEAVVIEPAVRRHTDAVLYYTDIFQLTESTLRTARRLASAGIVVCLPEIYPRELAGRTLEFDDAGKQAGLAGAAHTTTAQFDSDCSAALDYLQQRDDVDRIDVVGFCLGGHLAFRAAFDPRVSSTVCFYPTGLHNGSLGSDQADSLARATDISGRLMITFGSNDPHVPAEARLQIISALYAAGLQHVELHLYSGGEHAFMRDVGPRHDPLLTDLSLTEAISFLNRR
jgi:carboxymethylenebutenolidase